MLALLSVSNKHGLEFLASSLHEMGVEMLSTGGTYAAITNSGLPAVPVAAVTGVPEMLGGRVKTLHPAIHGGILADRRVPTQMSELGARGIRPIDLVVVNLYPFAASPDLDTIDIGGPAMVRAAAKNHENVIVVVDPNDYVLIVELLKSGELSPAIRSSLARKAFAHTASYDASIADWLGAEGAGAALLGGAGHDGRSLDTSPAKGRNDTEAALPPARLSTGFGADSNEVVLPDSICLALRKAQDLRYGENPHQIGARYVMEGADSWWERASLLQGKPMSYLNVYDVEAAYSLLGHLPRDNSYAVVVKHGNPCGVSAGTDSAAAYQAARDCDPDSAYGGVVAIGGRVCGRTAAELVSTFVEVVIAPAFGSAAVEVLASRPNLRVIEAPVAPEVAGLAPHRQLRSVPGGVLVQSSDQVVLDRAHCEVVTIRAPTDEQWRDLEFAWIVAGHVSSNCIVLAKDSRALGIGAGQQNRRDAGQIAMRKAAGRAEGGVCASDAFFPFRDGLEVAADAGVFAVIQPGGSIRDPEVIAAADELSLAMVFTGTRHFRH